MAALVVNALNFWIQRSVVYPLLTPVALDLISALASHAYVERIISLCGMLTAGRRDRMEKSLQMHVLLKLNILFYASTVLVSLAAIHES